MLSGWWVERSYGQKTKHSLGFSKEDRDENIRRITYVAKLITRCGGVAITCAISPYRTLRDEARQEIGRFVEIYVKCALDVCIERDVKGLYAKALRGEIPAFTGISDPYDAPLAPEVVVETDREAPEESLASSACHTAASLAASSGLRQTM